MTRALVPRSLDQILGEEERMFDLTGIDPRDEQLADQAEQDELADRRHDHTPIRRAA